MVKPSITLGLKKDNSFEVLYVGQDSHAALKAVDKNQSRTDLVEVYAYKKLLPWKRRTGGVSAQVKEVQDDSDESPKADVKKGKKAS